MFFASFPFCTQRWCAVGPRGKPCGRRLARRSRDQVQGGSIEGSRSHTHTHSCTHTHAQVSPGVRSHENGGDLSGHTSRARRRAGSLPRALMPIPFPDPCHAVSPPPRIPLPAPTHAARVPELTRKRCASRLDRNRTPRYSKTRISFRWISRHPFHSTQMDIILMKKREASAPLQ